jgi:hypothetical protein
MDMATEKSLSGGSPGAVLETYGGKSLKRIVALGAVVFGCALAAAILIRLFWPDHPAPAAVVLGVGVAIALGYVSTNWAAALAKVEVCEGGLRLFRYDGGTTELPWDRILKVTVGQFRKLRAWPEHVVIRTTDGNDIEFPEFRYGFWASVGTERFATTVQKFVKDVKVDVDFFRPKKAIPK